MALRKAPFRYGPQKTKTMMWLIQAALLVNLIASTVLFTLAGFEGWRLLLSAGVAIVVGVVVEFMFYRSWKRPQTILALLLRKQSAMIPMMVALLLPLHAPLYLVAVSTLVSVWIAKLVFGGFGNSIFQNATVGVLFAYVSFGPQIALTPALIEQGVFYPIDVLKNALFNNTTSGLDVMALLVGGEYYTIAAGAMSGLVLLGIWLVLSVTKTIDWILGATYLAVVFTISTIVGGTALGFEMLVTGMVLFAAVFLVSDPVTSPTTRNTKVLYAVIVAVVTVMIRVLGNNTEGVLFAILIGNVVTPYMNRNARSGSLRTLIQTTAIAMVLTVAAGFIILQVSQPAIEEVAITTEVLIHETL
jgi:Na+-translocating ferredoxin:NAD+ oxidoreductase subunit D